MAFFLRKALKLGPLRLNLSKSGVGISAGVTGARIGVRADGQPYVFAGRKGLYYRQNLGTLADDSIVIHAAEVIAELLDETVDEWLPAVQLLHDSSATEQAKSEAAQIFQAHTLMVRDELKHLGFPLGPEGEFAQAVSNIHSDLILQRAFSEEYDAWNPACDELLTRAAKEATKVIKKREVATLTKLASGEALAEVINELGEQAVIPHLKAKGLVIEDNPVYAMRLGSTVSDAILSHLLKCIPE
jgi:hypothetical protein